MATIKRLQLGRSTSLEYQVKDEVRIVEGEQQADISRRARVLAVVLFVMWLFRVVESVASEEGSCPKKCSTVSSDSS